MDTVRGCPVVIIGDVLGDRRGDLELFVINYNHGGVWEVTIHA